MPIIFDLNEPTPPSAKTVTRASRFALTLIASAISIPLILLLSLNIFINTGLRVLLNQQPERVQFAWTRAYSFYPGRVEVWGLRIRSQDEGAQWLLNADHARGTIDLVALLDYRFSVSELSGEGGSFRFRTRRTEPIGLDEPSAAPPIDGLQNPPDPSPEALYGPPARLFRIQIHDMVVENVRELWIQDYRFIGNARLETDLELLAHEWVQIDNLTLNVADGELKLGDATVAHSILGQVDFSLKGSNPENHPPQGILGLMTSRVAFTARVNDLRFLSFYLRKAPWLSLTGGTGALEMDLSMNEGRLLPNSRLSVDTQALVARFLSYAVTGDAKVRAAVETVAGVDQGRLTVDFLDYNISEWGDEAAHVRGSGLHVAATTPDLLLSEPFLSLDVELEMPSAVIPDLGVYNTYLPPSLGISLLDGTGSAYGRLQASTNDNLASGDLYLSADNVRARMDDLSLSGDAALHVRLEEGRLGEGVYNVSGSALTLRQVGVVGSPNERLGKDNSKGWWGDLSIVKATIVPDQPVFLDASLAVRMRDSVPFVTVFSEKQPLPGWIRGLLKLDDLSGTARVLLGEDSLVIPSLHLHGAVYEMQMQLRRRQELFYGNLYARYGALSLGVKLEGENSRIHLFNARKWYDAQPAP